MIFIEKYTLALRFRAKVWPTVSISLPRTHIVLDADVPISLSLPAAPGVLGSSTGPFRCRSLHADPGHFILELVYFGRVETKNGQRVVEPRKVSHSVDFSLASIVVIYLLTYLLILILHSRVHLCRVAGNTYYLIRQEMLCSFAMGFP